MQLRRSLTCVLVLGLGALTSCGFDLATDRPFTPGEGAYYKSGSVDVLSAVVVAAQPNEGTFIATLVNNSSSDDAALNGLAGPDLEIDEFEPIEIGPRGAVDLSDDGGITLSGDFDAGQLLPLTLTFANGDTAELNVPIVTACGPYLDMDQTVASSNVPYDCDFEPPAPGEGSEAEGSE